MPPKVAIIGAGPSGILTVRVLKPLHDSGRLEVVVFEKQHTFGGQWNYCDETGLDRWSESVPSSMYKNLWINAPVPCLELEEFPLTTMEPPLATFVPRERITEWWTAYVEKFELLQFMELDTRVCHVKFNQEMQKFAVQTQKFGSDAQNREFDYVIVATGHFSLPNDPEFDGLQTFPGKVVHSHDFRDGGDFKELRVLAIGGNYSADDIAAQCWKFGAKHVVITAKKPPGCDWPEGVSERPILTKINGKTVHFSDGTEQDFDAIIKCTGYKHSFPFLDSGLKLVTENTFSIPLYRQTVFPSNPKLLFVGMMNQFFTFPLFYGQAHFCANLITGKIQLPPKSAMEFDIQCEARLEKTFTKPEDLVLFQARHLNYFTEVSGLSNIDCSAILKSWLADRRAKKGILTFRDKTYPSRFTGISVETGWSKTIERKF